MPKNPLAPQSGEVQPVLFDGDANPTKFLNDLPPKVKKHVLAHGGNGFPPIMPNDEGKMPAGVVVCVRDRKGLIGYAKDGAGARLSQANLAAVKGAKPKQTRKSQKDAKAKATKATKEAAGAPQSDSTPKPPQTPLPPMPEQGETQGRP